MGSPIRLGITLLSLLAFVSSAPAKSAVSAPSPLLTLKGVVDLCKRNDPTSSAACGSYIAGFVQGIDAVLTKMAIETVAQSLVEGRVAPTDQAMERAALKRYNELRSYCIDSVWTAEYVSAHIVQYGREHPDLLGEPPGEQVLKILAKAFPCAEH